MRKSYYIFCFLLSVILLTVTACRPRGILSSKQMEDIFVDLHTAEGILQQHGYNYGHDQEVMGYYVAILEQHGTTQAQFDSSLVWYTANPTIFDKIYPKVIERLQTQLTTFEGLMAQCNTQQKYTLSDWTHQCQYGLNLLYWQKKYEKNTSTFAYVKKML